MLSAPHTETVRATLPVVGGAIGEITTIFYQRLFTAHPDLERNLFNRGNQASGAQQAALAGAVAMYATMLVEEDPTSRGVIERIAHKHASLGIAPESYPVVYEHLFAAIVEVLGADVVTAPVAEAWTSVYWHMADELIGRERELYAETGTAPGAVLMPVTVTERRHQSAATVSFELAAAPGATLPEFKAGQYISVGVDLPDGSHQIRQYSLAHAAPGRWRISVRRDGAVSSYLHEYVFEGDVLNVSHAFGDVVLESTPDTPLVLVSAGIGITPVLGMLYHLEAENSGRSVLVVHADRTRSTHAHRVELIGLVGRIKGASLQSFYDDLPAGYPLAESEHAGRFDLAELNLPAEPNVYVCGPIPFMNAVIGQFEAAGQPSEKIWVEAFAPLNP